MNYELAKQLKEAGFPQGNTVITNNKQCDNPDCLKGHEALFCHSAYAPTLTELIKACGDRFGKLEKDKGMFFAYTNNNVLIDGDKIPEIVVATLWLNLNETPTTSTSIPR